MRSCHPRVFFSMPPIQVLLMEIQGAPKRLVVERVNHRGDYNHPVGSPFNGTKFLQGDMKVDAKTCLFFFVLRDFL